VAEGDGVNLRKLAEGQVCSVRLPGCQHSPETVVLAHIRRANIAGTGQKPPDLCACFACMSCHSIIDGRESLANLGRAELDSYILHGLLRTLVIVSREAKL
jgi:hypothetical protein